MSELNNQHYLRAITKLGDTRKIVADCDIYSQSGLKLVAAGVRISSELYDHLVKHKMSTLLDNSLSVERVLDSKGLLQDLNDLFSTNELLAK
jgi:hypothetical protein